MLYGNKPQSSIAYRDPTNRQSQRSSGYGPYERLSGQSLDCVGDTGEVRMSDVQLIPINFIGFCTEME